MFSKSTFLQIAFSRQVVLNALRVSLVVGSILVLINYGAALINLTLSFEIVTKILLNYVVPYCVSSYSAVKAIQNDKD